MITDHDAWRDAEAGVEAAEILNLMRANADAARRTVMALARTLPEKRAPSPVDRALDMALVTPRSAWSGRSLARLDAVMRRILAQDSVDG
jgi:5'-methylthioadenosine phosphorylase